MALPMFTWMVGACGILLMFALAPQGALFDYDEIAGTKTDGDKCDFMVEVA
jgi:hypothetical protein